MFTSGAFIKPGTIQAFGGNTAPDGWLFCDGSTISRTLYADLYSVIGDTYGAGDGSTTFNLPNLTGILGTQAGCLGNGMATGTTNGTLHGGMWGAGSNVAGDTRSYTTAYGVNVGQGLGSGSALTGTVGITEEVEKSGIITDLTTANQKAAAIIKY